MAAAGSASIPTAPRTLSCFLQQGTTRRARAALPPPQVPPHCVPIHANVTTYNWGQLYKHTQFDVIMMDPPWQLATANPTRGVALG